MRPLHDELVRLLPLFLLIRALAAIGWFAERPEHAERDEVSWLVGYADENLDSVLAGLA